MPLCANKQPSDARSNSEAIKNYSLNTEHNKASNNNRGKVQPEEQGNEKLTGKAPPNLFFLALCILASRTIARCRLFRVFMLAKVCNEITNVRCSVLVRWKSGWWVVEGCGGRLWA